MEQEDILIQLGQLVVRLDALLVVLLGEQLDFIDERHHGPGGLLQHRPRHCAGIPGKGVSVRHAGRHHGLDAAEKLLVFQFLVAETHQGFQRHLVPQPMVPADLQDFGDNKAFHESEHVGVGAPLDPAQPLLVAFLQKIQGIRLGKTVRKELLGKIKCPSPQYIPIDVPTNSFRAFDALRIQLGGYSVHRRVHLRILPGDPLRNGITSEWKIHPLSPHREAYRGRAAQPRDFGDSVVFLRARGGRIPGPIS